MIPAPSCQVSLSLQVFLTGDSAIVHQRRAAPAMPWPGSWPTVSMSMKRWVYITKFGRCLLRSSR